MSSPVAVGAGPLSVATGDFNLDGTSDLAVVNTHSNSITVLLGNGAGMFSEATGSPVRVGASPYSVAVGDFDLDGKPDLAVTNSGSDNLTLLLGNGAGGFAEAAASPIGVGSFPTSVAIDDFNLDGKPDLAVANNASDSLSILLGDGSGEFAEAAGSPFPVGLSPFSVVVGDFNLDGKPDLVVVSNSLSNTVSIQIGDGFGGFTGAPGSPIAVGGVPYSVAVGDFNLDGKPDLAVANSHSDNVTILLGNGFGGFMEPPHSPVSTGRVPASIAVGDFDLDGKPDLAVANYLSDTVTLLLGNGSGDFAEASGSPVRVGSLPVSIAVRDLDLDGRPDVAVANANAGTVSILLDAANVVVCPASNACAVGLCEPATGACTTAPAPFDSACNDENPCTTNDGCRGGVCGGASVVCTALDPCHLPGTCDPARGCSSPNAPDGTTCDDREICTSSSACRDGSCVGGNPAPDGTVCDDRDVCTRTDTCRNGSCAGSDPIPCSPLDQCHAAGTCDPVTGCSNPNQPDGTVCSDENECTQRDTCHEGSCAGVPVPDHTACDDHDACTFAGDCRSGICKSPVFFTQAPGPPIGAGNSADSIATGDFDRDGALDLAVASFSSNTVSILLGNGSGGFTNAAGSPISVEGTSESIAAGDFNRDGKPDLAVAIYGSPGFVSILLGNGAGGFTKAVGSPVAVGPFPSSVAVADFDHDGNPDLAVANYTPPGTAGNPGSVTILLGDGSGRFFESTGSPIGVGYLPVSVAVGDFNLDGAPDLAVTNQLNYLGIVTILLGDGAGNLVEVAGSPVYVETDPTSIVVGDLNLDGRPDLAVVNTVSGTVTILLGDGSGVFTPAPGLPVRVGGYPNSVALGDFNLDGKPDLAVASSYFNVTIFLGNGDGGFTDAAAPVAPYYDRFVTIGDFNRDGRPDLAVANVPYVSILLNTSRLMVCPASEACLVGLCDPATGACTTATAPDDSVCSDGNQCTTNETCHEGACAGTPVVCAALDQCRLAGTCDPAAGCSSPNAPDGTTCNDRSACTNPDRCQNGSCVGANPVVCTPLDECHVPGTCDPASGTCSSPPAADGTPCSEGNACTSNDTCSGGNCVSGPPADCNDLNVCTDDSCDPVGGCVNACNGACRGNPRNLEYWQKLCRGRCRPGHQGKDDHDDHGDDASAFDDDHDDSNGCGGEGLTLKDVDCVNNSCTFAGVQTVADLCDRLTPNPKNDKCQGAEAQLMALLLNTCRCRLADTDVIANECARHGHEKHGHPSDTTTVGAVKAHADAILCNPARMKDDCKLGECLATHINPGEKR